MRRAIAISFILVLLAPVVLLASRIAETPRALRFAPPQSALVVNVSSPEVLWHALESHLTRADKGRSCSGSAPESDGKLSTWLRSVRCDLQDQNVSIKSLDAVRAEGIDITRAAVLALNALPGETTDISFVAAVPVSDEAAFRKTLDRLGRTEICAEVLNSLIKAAAPRSPRSKTAMRC